MQEVEVKLFTLREWMMKVAQGGPMMMNTGSNANKTDDKETVEVEVEMKAIEEGNEPNELKLNMK